MADDAAILVKRWRELEHALRAKDLGWGLHYAPADLRWARRADHPRGAEVTHLLPDDYRAFVSAVGYPVLGFCYYDSEGFSMLPAEAMEVASVGLFVDGNELPRDNTQARTRCTHAFFAGYELSDIEGFSFGPSADDENQLVVWVVEGAQPREEAGSFTEWMTGELDRLHDKVRNMTPADIAAALAENDGETDPHRVIDYSLDKTYDVPPYSKEDLALAWVEHQAGDPYDYGLIDGDGVWQIPLGKKFISVRPFRGGVAEVILNKDGADYSGPWTKIGITGALAK
jgi:hypothetical protein